MNRALTIVLLAILSAGPLSAQAPLDLMMRVDRSNNAADPEMYVDYSADPDDVPEVTVTAVENGFQVVTGPAVTLWRPEQTVRGNYTLSGRFTLLEPSSHRNFYGLIFGGRNLNTENQRYLYFMVAQTGEYVIINRIDDTNTNHIQTYTERPAVQRPDANGRSVNELALRVGAEQIEFVVNGTVVHAAAKAGATPGNERHLGRSDQPRPPRRRRREFERQSDGLDALGVVP